MTSLTAKIAEQMQAKRDAQVEKAINLLRQVAAAEKGDGKEPKVGDLVTMFVDLGITSEEVARYVELDVRIRELEQLLESKIDQGPKHRELKERERALKSDAEEYLKRYKATLGEIQKNKQRLDSLDSTHRDAERRLATLRTELTAMERRFRNLPDEPKVVYHPPKPIMNPDLRALHRIAERAANRNGQGAETLSVSVPAESAAVGEVEASDPSADAPAREAVS